MLTPHQEADQREFEQRKQEREQVLDAKTAKNRAKRQKKKEKVKTAYKEAPRPDADGRQDDGPIKKRRLVNGKELVFKKRDERESDEEIGPVPDEELAATNEDNSLTAMPASDVAKITVH